MITVIGNLFINSKEKLAHFKDSFLSIHFMSTNWVINIRGEYREEAFLFIRPLLKDALVEFSLLDDQRGWAANLLDMMPSVLYDYVLLWNEDHVNLLTPEDSLQLIGDLYIQDTDCLEYTWWPAYQDGQVFVSVPKSEGVFFDTFSVTKEAWVASLQPNNTFYLLGMPSIFKKTLILKLLNEDLHKWPWFVSRCIRKSVYLGLFFLIPSARITIFHKINSLIFKDKLPRFSKLTPFNLEKEGHRTDYLPLNIGMPKQEIFACIDDDLGFPGYKLTSRNPKKIPYSMDF